MKRRDHFSPAQPVRWIAASAASAIAAAAAAALIWTGGPGLSAQPAGPCDPPNGNPVVCENQKTGNLATEWDIAGAGDSSIQGFATDISVNRGETINFKINTTASTYRLDIYRMGYYGGAGARKVATVDRSGLVQTQPSCLSDAATGLIDCGNWSVSASWTPPVDSVSGIYFAKVVRPDTGGGSHIAFVVRDDASTADLFFQTSDTTWQAYNEYGGNSLYVGGPAVNPNRAYKVSYNRPFTTRETAPENWLFNAEYPMVRWLEANGYNVAYTSGLDSDRSGSRLLQHKTFLSVGHDEYWSGPQRANVEAARAAGIHLAFFSGNEIFWKTRWENSLSLPATAGRTLVSYKETHANAKIDPQASVWTGTWEDPRFTPPTDGGRPANALTGTLFRVNNGTTAIQVPAADGKMRFWRNTAIASLAPGATATLAPGTLGYEWDEDVDNAFRPAGLVRLSSTSVTGVQRLQDYGSNYAPGSANHAMTFYRHASGALVFGAGTIQWSWGLDPRHDGASAAPSLEMQQATLNLFADMGVQPLTVQPGLFGAVASSDLAAPASSISSPADAAAVPSNSTIVVTGTAADAGGGQVGGVEVSVDGGTTWRRALGRESWTYLWKTGSAGSVALRSRAADDSGNLEQPLSGPTIDVGGIPSTCPCSLWSSSETPASGAAQDPSAVELGTRFSSDRAGYVTGIRFYKSSQDIGAHVGSLWSASGTRLASVNFDAQTESGWQEATLGTPVAISAGVTYIVSYHTDRGYFVRDDGYFSGSSVDNGPLHAPQDTSLEPNGVFRYGTSAFPDQTYASANYWADVVFNGSIVADTTAPTVTSVTPAAGSGDIVVNVAATVTFSEEIDPGTITGSTFTLRNSANALVPSTVSYAAVSRKATLRPTAPLLYSSTYTAAVTGGSSGVKDPAGNALAADVSWSFTTTAPPPPPPTTGPGGPILVIASSANPFSLYYAEILRAEGMNAFGVQDLADVTSVGLQAYDVVILGEMPLSTAQVTMLTDYVMAGGKLIAMRPDKKLASLLGLTDLALTVDDAYLLVNTAIPPGTGIVGQTMQFHGTSDRYSLNGATSIAGLYASSAAATTSPAVTVRTVGSNGGQAAAFAYDLARSVVYTRQGNPAWAGQERDGIPPVRSDDLFFGGVEANYVDLAKVAIPQADEQQRLLANLVGFMSNDRKPLPKFWYLPRGLKAVVVMTGDDHANNGTAGRFDIYNGNSVPGCSVVDWTCIRATSYMFPNTPIPAAQVAAFTAQGFEIAAHMWMSGLDAGSDAPTSDCHDFTPASIVADYSKQLERFGSLFPMALPVRTNRTHCIIWSDYSTQAEVALANGIRLDTNYYYWPATWVNDVPGLFTGSGLPMRFAKADGTMIDVYQATSQMTDESGQSYPLTVDTLLDRALGPEGYYGAFVANMHTDTAAHPGSEAIVASAQARGVPIISAKQLLTWVDGRNGSSFGAFGWNGTALGFTISAAAGANNLQTLLPASHGTKTLTGLTSGGVQVPYSTQTIKGVSYAVFASVAGAYTATYVVDTTPPVISGVSVMPGTTSATIAWTTDEAATTRVDYGISAASLSQTVTVAGLSTTHSLQLTGLAASTTYYYRVVSADAGGDTATAPAPPAAPATFTTTAPADLSCPCSIWPTSTTPVQVTASDSNPVEIGLKFRSSADGFITGVRFYKGPSNIGPHLGSLWSLAGVRLVEVAFSDETASGWQQAMLARPVAITANTTYVVSYHTESGFYSGDRFYFVSSGVTNGPLQALANGVNGANGVYQYGAGGFPTTAGDSTNYWVDVVFDDAVADTTPPTVTGTTPVNGATGVATGTSVTATFSEDINPATVSASTVELRDAANVLVPATVTYSQPTRTVTLQPSAPLAMGATYTVLVRGGPTGLKDLAGNPLALDRTWSFTTIAPPVPSADILWTNSQTTNAITAVNRNTGALIRQFNPGKGDGRGIVVVGATIYYTVRQSNSVFMLNATTGADLGVAFTLPGQTTLQQLAFDGTNFWIPYGVNQVANVTPAGVVLKTIALSLCSTLCDGLEYFDGKLISSRGSNQNPATYDVYDTNGNLLQAGFIQHNQAGRGLAYDGTRFYVSGSQTISVYDAATGVFIRSMTPGGTGKDYEDLSFEYVAAGVPVRGDFDGDGKIDRAIYRTDGIWQIYLSSTNFATAATYNWGISTDIPVPADYDGDGKTDIAVYRATTGYWYVARSSTGFATSATYAWGAGTDIPVPADYDGDGKADLAIYRPETGYWYVARSSTGFTTSATYAWGVSTDKPLPADYDGDGKADLAVYRPGTGVWYIARSSTGFTTAAAYEWGIGTDIPIPADYDGDGKTDIGVYRPANGTWYIPLSSTNFTTSVSYQWGVSTDLPVPYDVDGDGHANIGVYRPSTGVWYFISGSGSTMLAP